MFNIGLGEFIFLAVIALLVIGPEKLPGAASHAAGLLRQARSAAVEARQQVTAAAGLDDASTAEAVRDLKSLHPRRLATSMFEAEPERPAKEKPAPGSALDPDLP